MRAAVYSLLLHGGRRPGVRQHAGLSGARAYLTKAAIWLARPVCAVVVRVASAAISSSEHTLLSRSSAFCASCTRYRSITACMSARDGAARGQAHRVALLLQVGMDEVVVVHR